MTTTVGDLTVVYNTELIQPTGIAAITDFLGTTTIYCSDTDSNIVFSIDSSGGNYTDLSISAGLSAPYGIGFFAGVIVEKTVDVVLVADSTRVVSLFPNSIKPPADFITDINGYDVVIERKGNVNISQPDDNKVAKYSPIGEFLLAYDVDSPSGLAVDSSNNLYVASRTNGTVTKFDSFGTIVNTYTGFNNPIGLAVDDTGALYVADSGNNKVVRIDDSGALIELRLDIGVNDLSKPWGVAVVPSEGKIVPLKARVVLPQNIKLQEFDLYITDTGNKRIVKYKISIGSEPIICFKEDSKILTDKGYRPIKDLRNGDLVKTLKDDFKPIHMIAKKEIFHAALKDRIKDQLYKCSKDQYPELFEDLVITGAHCILVDNFVSEEQKEKAIQINGKVYVTDGKYRLPACVDNKTTVYETAGRYTIYHLALEHNDHRMNYGIYANGLLVETCSKRFLKELSDMTVVE